MGIFRFSTRATVARSTTARRTTVGWKTAGSIIGTTATKMMTRAKVAPMEEDMAMVTATGRAKDTTGINSR